MRRTHQAQASVPSSQGDNASAAAGYPFSSRLGATRPKAASSADWGSSPPGMAGPTAPASRHISSRSAYHSLTSCTSSRPRHRSWPVARAWLADVGIENLAHRRPSQLSGGQAQRVAIARALAAEPKLLLLDEPMAALDVAVAPAVRQTLRTVLQDRSAIIVTHDVLDALLLADRVIVIDNGRVVEEGPSSIVLAQPRSAFAARIAGLNLIEGTWTAGGLVTAAGIRIAGAGADPLPREGDRAVAMFRPSTVSVFQDPPGVSPRNALQVTITHLEPLDDRVRVHADELSADVTPQAAADLDLAPGATVHFTIKATEVAVYPT